MCQQIKNKNVFLYISNQFNIKVISHTTKSLFYLSCKTVFKLKCNYATEGMILDKAAHEKETVKTY